MDDSNNSVFTMPVAPAYTGYGNNGGFGNGFGGDWAWILLLLVLFGGNGWGNNFGGGWGGNDLYPWMNQSQHISDGFRDQMLNTSVSSIGDKLASGFGDVQTALCSGFAGVTNGFNQAQITNLQSFNALQAQLANCCCENRAATQDLKYTLASEECATRTAATQNTQAILDKLCQLELDGYKRENDSLRSQLTDARFAASQAAQTATFQNGLNNEVDALYNRLKNCPVPSMPVYGATPIFTCGGNTAGCGCGGSF